DEAAPLAARVFVCGGVDCERHDDTLAGAAALVDLREAVDDEEVEAFLAVNGRAAVDGQCGAVGVVAADEHTAGQHVVEVAGQVQVLCVVAAQHAHGLAAGDGADRRGTVGGTYVARRGGHGELDCARVHERRGIGLVADVYAQRLAGEVDASRGFEVGNRDAVGGEQRLRGERHEAGDLRVP